MTRLREIAVALIDDDRRAMNPIDVARALQAYLDAHPEMTQQALAQMIGRPTKAGAVWVANKLALLRMDDRVIERLETGEIKEYQAFAAREHLGDGRGRPRAIPLPEEDEAHSRSISVPIGRFAGSTAAGSVDLAIVTGERPVVDVAVHAAGRGLFLTLSIAEAKLLGRRLSQAADALEGIA